MIISSLCKLRYCLSLTFAVLLLNTSTFANNSKDQVFESNANSVAPAISAPFTPAANSDVENQDLLGQENEVLKDFNDNSQEKAQSDNDNSNSDNIVAEPNTDTQTGNIEDDVLVHDDNIINFPKINIYTNSTVERFINMYVTRKRNVLMTGFERYTTYAPLMLQIFSQYNLPPELVNLALVESNFNHKAVSKARATGIWQFMSGTGKLYGLNNDFYYDERLNVVKATNAAANLLRDLYATFNDWDLALAAYNSGIGTVRRAIRRNQAKNLPTDFWHLRLPKETRGYVPAFHAINIIIKDYEKYGISSEYFSQANRPSYEQTKALEVPGSIKFSQISKKLGIDYDDLVRLNPEYKMEITPPAKSSYNILVPVDYVAADGYLDSFSRDPIPNMIRHVIRKGETFGSIARLYRISTNSLRALNNNISPNRLQIGKSLVVSIANVNGADSKKLAENNFTPADNKKLIDNKVADSRITDDNSYTVVRGDTLNSIANYFGVNINKLIELNKPQISLYRPLQIGQTLTIR